MIVSIPRMEAATSGAGIRYAVTSVVVCHTGHRCADLKVTSVHEVLVGCLRHRDAVQVPGGGPMLYPHLIDASVFVPSESR